MGILRRFHRTWGGEAWRKGPGKEKAPLRKRALVPWTRRSRSSGDLDAVAFDDRVGQQLVAHGLDLRLGLGGVGFSQVELDGAPHPHAGDVGPAQAVQGGLDGLALDVEDAGLEK